MSAVSAVTTNEPLSPFVPVAFLCAAGLIAAALVVADTDLERVDAPPHSVVVVQQQPAPVAGMLPAPAPRRVVVVRRRSRAS